MFTNISASRGIRVKVKVVSLSPDAQLVYGDLRACSPREKLKLLLMLFGGNIMCARSYMLVSYLDDNVGCYGH